MAAIYARGRVAARTQRRPARPSFPVGCALVNRQTETDEGTGLAHVPNHPWRVIWVDGPERYLASDATGALLIRSIDQVRVGFFATGGAL